MPLVSAIAGHECITKLNKCPEIPVTFTAKLFFFCFFAASQAFRCYHHAKFVVQLIVINLKFINWLWFPLICSIKLFIVLF